MTNTTITFERRPHLRLIENIIIEALVKHLLENDCKIAVHDGEADPSATSNDLDRIMRNIGHTDDTSLEVHARAGKSFIYLVHGNDYDVISDYGVSLEELVDPITKWIDTLEA